MVAAKPARGRQQRPLLLLAELAELLINVATQVEHRRASAAMMLSIVPHHTGLPQDMLTPAFVSGSGFVASMSKGDRAEPRQRLDKVTVCGAMRRGSTAGVSGLAQHRRDRHRGEVEGRRWDGGLHVWEDGMDALEGPWTTSKVHDLVCCMADLQPHTWVEGFAAMVIAA